MNLLNILTWFYGKLHNYKGVPFWVLTPLRRATRSIADILLPKYLAKLHQQRQINGEGAATLHTSTNRKQSDKKIIVSLTSFPARINNVWQVIICMLSQTLQPDKIILWLSKKQFPTTDAIPESLRKLECNIFNIRLVDEDLRSHKKYYYVSLEYADDNVFLIDDDIYYPTTHLENTWKEFLKHENTVIGNYGRHICYDVNGIVKSYNSWKPCYYNSNDRNLFLGSGGGTLFRPSKMYKDLTNIELALKLTPLADDVWLNAMARLGNQNIYKLKSGLLLPIRQSDENETLSSVNVGLDKNDEQIRILNEYYFKLFNKYVF